MEKWAWISKLEMKGEIFSGSSGVTAPVINSEVSLTYSPEPQDISREAPNT
jgi:hypothetical protein